MFLAVRSAGLSRLAAVLVALVISGAAGLAGALAPEPPHRCMCRTRKGAEHRCACPECARIARQAQERAEVEGLPPCHREAALRTRAEERRREREREGARSCMGEDCGRGEGAGAGLRALEAFILPVSGAFVSRSSPDRSPASTRNPASSAPQPEPPPPRA